MTLTRREIAGGLAAAGLIGAAPASAQIRDDGLAELDAVQVAARFRRGELKAETYVGALLSRCERYRGLNAFTWIDPERALAAARRLDRERAAGRAQSSKMGAIAGVPLVVKDNIDTLGYPTSAGTPGLRNNWPTRDAPVMERLQAQGALLLGKANMQELASGGTSSNPHFGYVHNPYDMRRIPGGSSGGTAAAIAARLAPAGLGTDTAGSVRIPAALCGIAGLRPTTRGGPVYPLEGVVPLTSSLDTIGPMARCVADVALLDAAVRGTPLPSPIPPRSLRLGVPRRYFWETLEPGIAAPLEAALLRLKEAGVTLVEVDLKGAPARAAQAYSEFQAAGARDLADYMARKRLPITYDEMAALIATPSVKTRFTRPGDPALAAALPGFLSRDLPAIVAQYTQQLRADGLHAFIFPCQPVVAPVIGSQMDLALMLRNTRGTGALGLPGLTVPGGLSPDGLPAAFELDGLPGAESTLLGAGLTIEAVVGRLPPPRLA